MACIVVCGGGGVERESSFISSHLFWNMITDKILFWLTDSHIACQKDFLLLTLSWFETEAQHDTKNNSHLLSQSGWLKMISLSHHQNNNFFSGDFIIITQEFSTHPPRQPPLKTFTSSCSAQSCSFFNGTQAEKLCEKGKTIRVIIAINRKSK